VVFLWKEMARGAPIPILAALPLHRDAVGIADLDPDRHGTDR